MAQKNEKRENIKTYFDGKSGFIGTAIILMLIGVGLIEWGGENYSLYGYIAAGLGVLTWIGSLFYAGGCLVTGIIYLVIGAVITFFVPDNLKCYGYALIGLSIITIISSFFLNGSISDEQMDKYINEDLQGIEANAIKLLDFEEESLLTTPVFLTSEPDLLDVKWSGSDKKIKKGEDETIRYSPINVTILYPTKDMLAFYEATWDLLEGKALNENTDEYFYNDITSVSMKSTSTQLSKTDIKNLDESNEIRVAIKEELTKRAKKLPNDFDKLTISGNLNMSVSTSGGNAISVHLKNSELAEIAGYKSKDTAEMEKGIQTLRKLIRDKKSS